MIDCYHAATRCISSRHQPALMLEHAREREVAADVLLRGTALFEADILEHERHVSPAQCLRLLANLAQALPEPDTSFLLGQQLLPGHFGAASHALLHAQNLRQALEILAACPAALSPLLVPHLHLGGQRALLYWTDACGAPAQRGFLVEMQMTAVTAMCRWLAGERLPWQYCFNRTRPRYTEQHEVHLGPRLRFGCQLDAMLIDTQWLERPWPRGSHMAAALALRAAQEQGARASLLGALYDHLAARIRCAPTLEQCAQDFGVSPATFKRHLARHATHYQAELDQVRTHVALQLFHEQGYDNEAVARHLGFHDANNFRRSFKRWTGLTPTLLRQSLTGDC